MTSTVSNNYDDLYQIALTNAQKTLGHGLEDYAEDVAQNVMLTLVVMEANGQLDEETVFGLVKSAACRDAVDFLRKEARRREIEQEHGESINRNLSGSAVEVTADPIQLEMFEEAMDRITGQLSPLLQETLERYYVEGWTAEEIAENQQIPVPTVYKRLQRARDFIEGKQ